MKKGGLYIGLCREINAEKFEGPTWRAFFNLSPEPCGLSSTERAQRKSSGPE
jgi:hypothetical protein